MDKNYCGGIKYLSSSLNICPENLLRKMSLDKMFLRVINYLIYPNKSHEFFPNSSEQCGVALNFLEILVLWGGGGSFNIWVTGK